MAISSLRELEKLEIEILLDVLYRQYGYDFRNYAKASLKRRLRKTLSAQNKHYISELIPDVLYNADVLQNLVFNLSVTVTEMFRDPTFFLVLRKKVLPYLKTYPFIKIWHAGCATGEEVYSMAILLKEEGIYDRVTILATDFNDVALNIAKEGIYKVKDMQQYTDNYSQSGGKSSFSDYYHAKYDSVIMKNDLKKNITFANHNLSTDGVFGEMHLILCRNVMIYFDKVLQNRVLDIFNDSLIHGGFLCLGNKETLHHSDIELHYSQVDRKNKIFQKRDTSLDTAQF